MLLVSQRDVDKYGSQPVGITLYFYVVGFRVNPVRSCILFCVYHIFVSSPNLLPYSGFHFLFLVGLVPSTSLDFANFH